MHHLDGFESRNRHKLWSADLNPVLWVKSGDKINIRIPDSSTLQINKNSTTRDLASLDHSELDAAVGPVLIEGAESGDVLEVKIEDMRVADWGWTMISHDFGLLKNRFRDRLFIWDIGNGWARPRGDFLEGISIPVSPFLGIIGVAPGKGEYGMIPPQSFGGNMDNRLLGPGSKIYLPVNVKGALLSLADPHAAQGDGEICGTAIETVAEVTISVNVIKGAGIKWPRAFAVDTGMGESVVTMGIGPKLDDAVLDAVEGMLDELITYGFTTEEGYALCSVTGNLRISEVVDEPNFVVSLLVPKKIVMQRQKISGNR